MRFLLGIWLERFGSAGSTIAYGKTTKGMSEDESFQRVSSGFNGGAGRTDVWLLEGQNTGLVLPVPPGSTDHKAMSQGESFKGCPALR